MIGQIYRGRSAPSWRPRCTSVERLGPVWDLSPRTNPHGSFSFMTYLVGITLTSSGLQCKTNCRSLTLPASTIGPKRLCMGPGLWHRTFRHPFHHGSSDWSIWQSLRDPPPHRIQSLWKRPRDSTRGSKKARLGVGGGGFQWEIAARTPPPLSFGLEQFRRGAAAALVPDVELRSASVLDYRIWRPQGRVTMLHGSLGTHRALSQI